MEEAGPETVLPSAPTEPLTGEGGEESEEPILGDLFKDYELIAEEEEAEAPADEEALEDLFSEYEAPEQVAEAPDEAEAELALDDLFAEYDTQAEPGLDLDALGAEGPAEELAPSRGEAPEQEAEAEPPGEEPPAQPEAIAELGIELDVPPAREPPTVEVDAPREDLEAGLGLDDDLLGELAPGEFDQFEEEEEARVLDTGPLDAGILDEAQDEGQVLAPAEEGLADQAVPPFALDAGEIFVHEEEPAADSGVPDLSGLEQELDALFGEAEEGEGDMPFAPEAGLGPGPGAEGGQIGEDGLPHVPALILDEGDLSWEGIEDLPELSDADIPDWLRQLRDVEDEGELEEPEDEGVAAEELAPATLPAWLEAMRPLESMRASTEEQETEEEEVVEAAGPLAGLKGVLLAEPVVAMPRSAPRGGAALDITDEHYRQADILRQMVEESEREEREAVLRRERLPILRWAVSLLLAVGIGASLVLKVPGFGVPVREPLDLALMRQFMSTLPTDQPVLLIYDYEPANAPEMEAVAGAMVDLLMARGTPVLSLSTRVSGPMLAERMLGQAAARHEATAGVDYAHLGYLAGGPVGMHLLSSAPALPAMPGFAMPEGARADLAERVKGLGDLAMIAVLSGDTESARQWVEQLGVRQIRVPVVMVTSAGVEPVVRPYYEGRQAQVDGLISGVPSAVIMEYTSARPASGMAYWSAYGTGVLLAAALLLGGTLFGLGRWLYQFLRV
jgi:hypothetical protein